MINLIEAAALAAIEHLLPPGHQSLGTRLDVRHIAATPVGMKIFASATVESVAGRTVTFRVEARDEKELIGDGPHERVVVNVAKFDQRVQKKLAGPAHRRCLPQVRCTRATTAGSGDDRPARADVLAAIVRVDHHVGALAVDAHPEGVGARLDGG